MKLLLTADLHIAKAEDTALLDRILSAAKAEGCSAVLIGGDLLDSPFPDHMTEQAVLDSLAQSELPILMVAGNHDPWDLTECYRQLPKNVVLFGVELSAYPLGEGVAVYGISDARGAKERSFLNPISTAQGEIKIFMGHGQPDGNDEAYFPISTAALAESGFSLALLGHVHKYEERKVGGCRILVPGIPEGRGWDEVGERYVWIAEIGKGMAITPKKVAEKTYREIEVDLTDCDEEQILKTLESVEIPADTVARLILTGAPLAEPRTAARLFSEKRGIAIKDRSDPTQSVAILMKQNTLQGAFVRRAMEEIEQAGEKERPLLEEALKMGLRALKEGLL